MIGKLSVVVPVRNEADGIRTMLDSLREAFDVRWSSQQVRIQKG